VLVLPRCAGLQRILHCAASCEKSSGEPDADHNDQRGNGEAERYWCNVRSGSHLVLCRNRKILQQPEPRARWRLTTLVIEDVSRDPNRRAETTSVASAGVTRTTRKARRRSSYHT